MSFTHFNHTLILCRLQRANYLMGNVEFVYIRRVLVGELHIEGGNGVVEILLLSGADYGRSDAFFEVPSKGYGRHSCAIFARQFINSCGDCLVLLLGRIILAARRVIRLAAHCIGLPAGTRAPARSQRTVGRERNIHLIADGN